MEWAVCSIYVYGSKHQQENFLQYKMDTFLSYINLVQRLQMKTTHEHTVGINGKFFYTRLGPVNFGVLFD